VLAATGGTGLTEPGSIGKTEAAIGSKQGMITHRIRTPGSPRGCHSPGPPQDVVQWRTCRLLEAGFPPALVDLLARMRVDLHRLLELVDAGCPPELAARILWPLDDDRDLPAAG
jgi:hypothetical protein